MSFGSAFGSSVLGGLFGNVVNDAHSINRQEALGSNRYGKSLGFFDPLGRVIGKGLLDEDVYQDNRQLAMLQNAAKWQFLNAPSLTKQGLIAAGYNPMLALGTSISSPSATTKDSPGTHGGSPLDIAGAYNNAKNVDVNKQNADTNEQNALVNKQNADTNSAAQVSQNAVNQSQVALNAQRILESKQNAIESASRVEKNNRDSRYPGPLGELSRTVQSAFEDGQKGFEILNQQAADALRGAVDSLHSAKEALKVRIDSTNVKANEKAKEHREKGLSNSSPMEKKYPSAPQRSIFDRR